MRLPEVFSFLGVSLATLLLLAAGPVNANGIYFTHNGYDIDETIFPGTGTGSVDVDFGCAIGSDSGSGYLYCKKDFHAVATHTISLGGESYGEIDAFSIPILEVVYNNTGVTWFDYHIDLEGVAFAEGLEIQCSVDCRIGDESNPYMLWVFFDEGLYSSDRFELYFGLEFEFDGTCDAVWDECHQESAITISQRPTVPEPATLLLLGLGLAGLGFARKRLH